MAIIYFSCTPEVEEIPVKVKADPVMREVTELVSLMFQMEVRMKSVREQIVNSNFSKFSDLGYDMIYSAEASKDVVRDSVYVSKGDLYLGYVNQLSRAESPDSARVHFNNVISTCISCHQDYCPGPVARIKKLRIN